MPAPRWRRSRSCDISSVSGQQAASARQNELGDALLLTYDEQLPHVYGYLLPRCGDQAVAEDLTAETFLAAVDAIRKRRAPPISTPWLIGIARHKLVDHWRRAAREDRGLRSVSGQVRDVEDPWDAEVDSLRAQAVLSTLAPRYRAALTLRYLDDLPVDQVAELLDRGVHATEGLLVRARVAFRRAYEEGANG